jgi:hypothetical protein
VIESKMSAHTKRLGRRLVAGLSHDERDELSSLLGRLRRNLAKPRD